MTYPNLASSARGLVGIRRVLLIALLLGASVLVGWLAIQTSTDGGVSLWWPAAGINAVAAVAVGRRYRWVVLVLIVLTTIPVSLAAGRPLLVAIVASLAIAGEAWIVTRFSVDRDDQPRLTTTRDVIRFFCGVLIGSSLAGVCSAAAIVAVSDGEYLTLVLSVMASHASAMIVIAPIALVNRMKRPMGRGWTHVAHTVLLTLAFTVSFLPGSVAPLAFLPVPFLAWSAFSFSMSVSLAQLIGGSALAVVLTSLGGGPFARTEVAWLPGSALIELYVITLSITTLLIASARNERQILEEQRGATAQLLHRGFELSSNGFMIVQHVDRAFTVLELNSAAIRLMPLSMRADGTLIEGSPVHAVLVELIRAEKDAVTIVNEDDGSNIPAILTVTRVTNSTFGEILLVSVVDLTAQRAAEEAARVQVEREQRVTEELRALNQQKDDFVSSVTHELRTPITTIMGFSEELDDTELDQTQKGYVSIILRNAERLLSVVEDVLRFSRRQPGTLHRASLAEIDLTEAVDQVLDDLRHSIAAKELGVDIERPELPVLVVGDANDLTRVLINLITNAVKFTPVGGGLTIVHSVADDVATLTITDTGPGIEPADIDRVFDRFYRASRAASDGVPGTGLGLSIVRELMTEMNGTVALESDGIAGTTARLTLPAVVAVPTVEVNA